MGMASKDAKITNFNSLLQIHFSSDTPELFQYTGVSVSNNPMKIYDETPF